MVHVTRNCFTAVTRTHCFQNARENRCGVGHLRGTIPDYNTRERSLHNRAAGALYNPRKTAKRSFESGICPRPGPNWCGQQFHLYRECAIVDARKYHAFYSGKIPNSADVAVETSSGNVRLTYGFSESQPIGPMTCKYSSLVELAA